jgi:hypothetical protein
MLSESGAEQFAVVPNEADSDEFVAWFHGIRPRVILTVPVLTMLGRSNEPAMLDGTVPIDPETARRLAGRATSFIRVLTHPETGATLSVGRRRYRVPEHLKIYLQLRDRTCRFPGCSVRVARCDIDHNHDWQYGGETAHYNLAHFCPGHHAIKGETDWCVVQRESAPGVLEWRSPSGRRIVSEPENPITS